MCVCCCVCVCARKTQAAHTNTHTQRRNKKRYHLPSSLPEAIPGDPKWLSLRPHVCEASVPTFLVLGPSVCCVCCVCCESCVVRVLCVLCVVSVVWCVWCLLCVLLVACLCHDRLSSRTGSMIGSLTQSSRTRSPTSLHSHTCCPR